MDNFHILLELLGANSFNLLSLRGRIQNTLFISLPGLRHFTQISDLALSQTPGTKPTN